MAGRDGDSRRREPVQERSKQLVAWILDAAVQVYDQRGYAAATTTRIAERAGISVGSLYQYFPDKHAILVALAERHIAEGRELALRLLGEALREPPPLEALIRLFVAEFLALHRANPTLHRLLFEEIPLPASVRARLREAEAELVAAVAGLLAARHDVAAPDPAFAAYALVSIVEALTHRYALHGSPQFDEGAYVEGTVALLLRTLRREPAA
ncbi:MAG TPA: TetR/AcrR family transcriptional regulator [Herpetosiphonaceae bacterium]